MLHAPLADKASKLLTTFSFRRKWWRTLLYFLQQVKKRDLSAVLSTIRRGVRIPSTLALHKTITTAFVRPFIPKSRILIPTAYLQQSDTQTPDIRIARVATPFDAFGLSKRRAKINLPRSVQQEVTFVHSYRSLFRQKSARCQSCFPAFRQRQSLISSLARKSLPVRCMAICGGSETKTEYELPRTF